MGCWPVQQDHEAAGACPLLPELGRCPGVLQGSYGQKARQGHSIPAHFVPLLLVLSALVGHAHSPRAGERQLLTLRVHTQGAAFALAIK